MKRPFNLFHRSNLYLRQNKVKRTFGNLTTWNTSFEDHFKKVLNDLFKFKINFAYNPNILEAQDIMEVKPGFDFVYLDPPYINGSGYSDNYNRKYHFLEGLCFYEIWNEIIDYNSPINEIYCPDHIRKWSEPKLNTKLLFDLIATHSKSIVALSYAEDGKPSLKELKHFFKQQFDHSYVSKQVVNYALAKSKKTEILIIGIPK